MKEEIPRRNAYYYPYELFRVADGVEKKWTRKIACCFVYLMNMIV